MLFVAKSTVMLSTGVLVFVLVRIKSIVGTFKVTLMPGTERHEPSEHAAFVAF